jgi:hypothetical protein
LARESNWQPLVGAIDDSWPELSAAVRRGVDIDEIVQIMMATTTSVGATVSRGIGFILKVLALDGVDTKHYRRRAEFRATRFGARNSPGTTSTAAEAPAITVAVEQLFRQLATYEQTLGSALAAGNIKLAKHCADELRQMRAELKGNASGDSQL